MDCLRHRSYGPIRVFFLASCSWWSEGLFGQSFSVALPGQAHRGAPLAGILLCRSVHRALKGAPWGGVLLCSSVCQAFDGPASLLFSCWWWQVWRESLWWWLHPLRDSAVSPCFRGCLAFLHRHFLPQSPPSHLLGLSLSDQQQPLALGLLHNPWTPAPSRCTFQGIYVPVWSMYGCSKDCIPFRLPQISCFTLSLKCFSSDSVAWMWRLDSCFSFATHQRGVPVLLTLLFFSLVPLSCQVLCGSIYLFPLVRFSCLLSAGVLYTLLCLKVYSWCICGERCTPCPLIPLPSCSPCFYFLIDRQPLTCERLHVVIQVPVVSRKFGIAPLTSLPTWQHLVVFRQILCSPVFHSIPQQASSGTWCAGPVGIELFYLVLQCRMLL